MISNDSQPKESSHRRAVLRLVSWQFAVVLIRTDVIRRRAGVGEDGGTRSGLLN